MGGEKCPLNKPFFKITRNGAGRKLCPLGLSMLIVYSSTLHLLPLVYPVWIQIFILCGSGSTKFFLLIRIQNTASNTKFEINCTDQSEKLRSLRAVWIEPALARSKTTGPRNLIPPPAHGYTRARGMGYTTQLLTQGQAAAACAVKMPDSTLSTISREIIVPRFNLSRQTFWNGTIIWKVDKKKFQLRRGVF